MARKFKVYKRGSITEYYYASTVAEAAVLAKKHWPGETVLFKDFTLVTEAELEKLIYYFRFKETDRKPITYLERLDELIAKGEGPDVLEFTC